MKSLAGAVGSAILLALFARLDARLAWLGWFALVPLMAFPAKTLGQALLQGYVLTTLFTLSVFGWFATSIADYTHQSPTLAWFAIAALAPLLQPQFLVFTLTRLYTRSVTAAICAWITIEWLYPKPLGDTLGYGMHPIPEIRQCADIAGVALITLAMLATSAILARFTKRSIVIAAAIIAAMVVYGSEQPRSRHAPHRRCHPSKPHQL